MYFLIIAFIIYISFLSKFQIEGFIYFKRAQISLMDFKLSP